MTITKNYFLSMNHKMIIILQFHELIINSESDFTYFDL